MDDLNPITRTERLLDGEDLTPTNREEMFIKRIYDKTQEIPEPVNRKEYFLKKAGEAGGDVTVVPLSVTDNGIYSEAGKAYSPVTVEVEPPEDSYQLKTITTPTSLATFNASEMPMPKLKVSVEAKQAGSGVPSPENVRPIIGWDEAKVSDVGKNIWTGDDTYTSVSAGYVIPSTTISLPIGTYAFEFDCSNPNGLVQFEVFKNNSQQGADRIYNSDGFNVSTHNRVKFTINEAGTNLRLYSNNSSGISISNVRLYSTVVTTTISLPQTVYGAEVDVVNGTSGNKLTHHYFEISNFDNWYYQEFANFKALYKNLSELGCPPIKDASDREFISDKFESVFVGAQQPFGTFSIYPNGIVYFWDNDNVYANKNEMVAAMNNIKPAICYELATPTTLTTQPTPIKSLDGQNNLSVDSGEVIEGEYFIALGGE